MCEDIQADRQRQPAKLNKADRHTDTQRQHLEAFNLYRGSQISCH